jgi:non-heme chloroperoxidase
MSLVNVDVENSIHINLYYEDLGTGQPVVLIHGWPLNGASWEKQTAALLEAGYRVIAYDRRGFGESSKPSTGYDYDTLAQDLDKLLNKLDLHDVTLVGFSMGGGEVARYLGKYGSERVSKAVFIGSITPYLQKADDNPDGVDGSVFEGIKDALRADRPAFLAGFLQNFYNVDAVSASAKGTIDCVTAWGTDFRPDLAKINIPTLIIHGDADRIVPVSATALRMQSAIKGAQLALIKDAPHGLIWTHADKVNEVLLKFLAG